MPITTRFDEELRIIVHVLTGELTPDEVLESQQELYGNGDHDPAIAVLWDCRDAKATNLSFTDMSELVQRSKPLWSTMGTGRTAILTGSIADYGMGRMYELLSEQMPREVRAFQRYDEALTWLKEPRLG